MEQQIDIKIKAAMDAVDASKTLGELKKSIKDLKSLALEAEEGSKQFNTLTSKIGEANDRLKDLNEMVAMKTGNNVENIAKSFAKIGSYGATSIQVATGAMGLFGDQSEETMKQLVKLQAAFNFANGIKAMVEGFDEVRKAFSVLMSSMKAMMASNPFTLILIAVVALIGVLFLLRNHIKPIGQMFDAIGEIIKKIIQAVKDFMDWLGLTNFAVKDSVEKNIKQYEKEQAAIEKRYDSEIKEAKKTGASVELIEGRKSRAVNKSVENQIKEYQRIIDAGEILTKEQQTQYDKLVIMNQDYYTDLMSSFNNYSKNLIDEQNKLELEIINLRLQSDPKNAALLKARADLEINLLKDTKTKELKLVTDSAINQTEIQKDLRDKGIITDEEYAEKVIWIANNIATTKKQIIDKYSVIEKNKIKETNNSIIGNYEETRDKINKIVQETRQLVLDNATYQAERQEEIYNERFKSVKDALIDEYTLQVENNGKIEEENERTQFQIEKILKFGWDELKKSLNEKLTQDIKAIRESEEFKMALLTKNTLEEKKLKQTLTKDEEARLENAKATLISYGNQEASIRQDAYNKYNELENKYNTISTESKIETYDNQIKIEEEGLNRTDVIFELKSKRLEESIKLEKELLKNQWTGSVGGVNQREIEIEKIEKKGAINREKLQKEFEEKTSEGRIISEKLEINRKSEHFNKMNKLLKNFLGIDKKAHDEALNEELSNLDNQKNNELSKLEEYYKVQRKLYQDNKDELEKIEKKYRKDILDIETKYEEASYEASYNSMTEWIKKKQQAVGDYFTAIGSFFSAIEGLVDQIAEQQIQSAEIVRDKEIEAIDTQATAEIANAERSITDTVALEQAKEEITNRAVARTLASKNKYAKEENKLKSKQFKVEKATNIAKATMDGVMAVMSALAQGGPYMGPILAALMAATAAVNIGMLASTKPPKELEGADVSGGSFTSPYSGGGGSGSSQSPTINTAAMYRLGQGGPNILSDQSGMNLKVSVEEGEIRRVSGRVQTIERRAGRGLN